MPEDRGLRGDGRPKVRRFRTLLLSLGTRLRAFREAYDVTQGEVAQVIAGSVAAISQWESGIAVPEGHRRERLVALLDGRLWRKLRAAVVAGEGIPMPWDRAVRSYRRASRERRARGTVGLDVAAVLESLRSVDTLVGLRQRYQDDDRWPQGTIKGRSLPAEKGRDRRSIVDAAYGLRWVEITRSTQFDLGRTLVPQLPLAALGTE